MILGRVQGSVVSTVKDNKFEGEKLMLVEPIDLDGQSCGITFMALDRAQAGKGDLVLINKEGGGTKIMYGTLMPVQALIVGIIDQVNVEYSGE